MDFLIEWIKEWGYIAVFLGATVEGESVILTASALAAAGYLSIQKIMLVAFFTTLFVDQGLFFIGRAKGRKLFDQYPRFKKPSDHAFTLLNKFDVWFIIGFRFIYGVRTIGSVVIGAAGVSPARFIPLNILSAVIWTLVSCLGGYFLGDLMFDAMASFEKWQKYVIGSLVCLIIIGFLIWKLKRSKSGQTS